MTKELVRKIRNTKFAVVSLPFGDDSNKKLVLKGSLYECLSFYRVENFRFMLRGFSLAIKNDVKEIIEP